MDREKVIEGLEECAGNGKCTKCQYVEEEPALSCKKLLADALELIKSSLLKEQEESIPISWLKEKLEGHPELSYAVTDGIINVLDLWEGRRSE